MFCTAMLLVGSMVVGQAEVPEQFKGYGKAFAGKWTSEFEFDAAYPALPNGETRLRFRVRPNGFSRTRQWKEIGVPISTESLQARESGSPVGIVQVTKSCPLESTLSAVAVSRFSRRSVIAG